MFLVSSNRRKLAELARYGLNLDLRAGADLPEVQGTPDEVALHKALAAGEGAVVEDTILILEGQPVVDVRWTLAHLPRGGVPVVWRVTLGHHAGDRIRLFRGEVEGHLHQPAHVRPEAFSFDPYLVPVGYTQSLDELEQVGRKDEVSARRRAALALLAGQPDIEVATADIAPWTGAWQGPGA
jgi:inosine/xanthosine triphosphate pyrophosphatase family protein